MSILNFVAIATQTPKCTGMDEWHLFDSSACLRILCVCTRAGFVQEIILGFWVTYS